MDIYCRQTHTDMVSCCQNRLHQGHPSCSAPRLCFHLIPLYLPLTDDGALLVSPLGWSTSVLLSYWRFRCTVPGWGLWVSCGECGSSGRSIVGAWFEEPSQSIPCHNIADYNVEHCSRGTPGGYPVDFCVSFLLENCPIPVSCALWHTRVIEWEDCTSLSLFPLGH